MSGIVSKNAGRASGIVGAGDIGADAVDGSNIADDAIDSEHYADGSIDNAHIADDAIDSEHYAAGSIDEAHIADNAVTLAKMAGGTDGNIISFDASGDPVAIATGDDGQVLTSTGAGSPPAFEAAAGGGKIVKTQIFQTTTYSSGTFLICPNDDTIPQSDEGHLCMSSGSYTPVSGSNVLIIQGIFFGSVSNNGNSYFGIWQDSDAGAIATWRETEGDSAANKLGAHPFFLKQDCTDTTAREYHVRLGGESAGTAYFLGGQSSGRKGGGVGVGNIIIYEIDPS
jgi:hypothetical protein